MAGLGLGHSPGPCIPFWGHCPWPWDLGRPTALGLTPKCRPLHPAGRQGVKCASVARLPPHIQHLEGCFLFLDLLNKYMPGCLQRDAASYTECAGPSSQGIGGRGGATTPLAMLSPAEWFCIKMGSGVSHFNRSVVVRGTQSLETMVFITSHKFEEGELKWTPLPMSICSPTPYHITSVHLLTNTVPHYQCPSAHQHLTTLPMSICSPTPYHITSVHLFTKALPLG